MTQYEVIDKLRIESRELYVALNDPQPGLATWWSMVADKIQNINNLWQGRPGETDAQTQTKE